MTSLCRHLSAQEIVKWVTTADGCVHTYDTTKLSPTSCEFLFTPPTPTWQNSFVASASASAVCIGHYGVWKISVTSRQQAHLRRTRQSLRRRGQINGGVTGLSRTCRGSHGEVGIMEFGLNLTNNVSNQRVTASGLHNSTSLTYFRWSPNVRATFRRNRKCAKSSTTAFGKVNRISTESANLSAPKPKPKNSTSVHL